MLKSATTKAVPTATDEPPAVGQSETEASQVETEAAEASEDGVGAAIPELARWC